MSATSVFALFIILSATASAYWFNGRPDAWMHQQDLEPSLFGDLPPNSPTTQKVDEKKPMKWTKNVAKVVKSTSLSVDEKHARIHEIIRKEGLSVKKKLSDMKKHIDSRKAELRRRLGSAYFQLQLLPLQVKSIRRGHLPPTSTTPVAPNEKVPPFVEPSTAPSAIPLVNTDIHRGQQERMGFVEMKPIRVSSNNDYIEI